MCKLFKTRSPGNAQITNNTVYFEKTFHETKTFKTKTYDHSNPKYLQPTRSNNPHN